jgi:hypothetical protein
MPLSSDPQAREAQLANLRQGNPQHGARSEVAIRPRRERLLAELRTEFPDAAERRLIVQAHRLAQLELLVEFADDRGVIAHRRRGTVYPAAQMAERIAAAFLVEQDRLEAQAASSPAGNGQSTPTLASIAAEYAGGEGGDQE